MRYALSEYLPPGPTLRGPWRLEATYRWAPDASGHAYCTFAGAANVALLLREYFTEMVEIIFRHGGTLDKFIGDAIMALWGAPFASEDDADKAMRAAIDMQRKLVELNQHWAQTGKPSVQIGIGINFGQVFAGNIGSEQRLEYTVLGDAVNTASRLCSKAGKGEIIISEPLHTRLKFPPQVEAREPLELKGKSQRVANYLAKF